MSPRPTALGEPKFFVDKEQKLFLDRRFRDAARQQPDLRVLRTLLLGFGGVHMVAHPGPDPDLPRLIGAGLVMTGPVMLRIMKKNGCHENVSRIWASKQHKIAGIGTGYSLSDDGLWRQHSWGIRRNGIIETTSLRVKYFGVLLQNQYADLFAMANLAG
jgi:hypothetical protein